ncbi:hypothetical protein ACTJJ0_20955 [Chitinophaga sp. 22321]|uniref:Uncharacterized protein n=1 Tax=Chitinophaga hostae TaxID=2831022 RepID=A0ABS5J418_9BACT|nr:hypothetical protein [Chitinophaga hostae]MBS0029956.1 hypothetical protein [Chitinophaga hostae]
MISVKEKENFHLSKWYLDTIDEKGDAVIYYIAHLRWKNLNLYYYNRLSYTAGKGVENKIRLKRVPIPEWEGTTLRWSHAMEVAEWQAQIPPVREILLYSEKGHIEWNCLLPHGRTTLTEGNRKIEGLGYAEQLNMTLLPWKFDIGELYWGRFLSSEHSIIWIEWRGPIPKFLVFHNGRRYDSGVVSETAVSFDGFRLIFSEQQVLRNGSLWQTLFSCFPWFKQIFPLKILLTVECKWRSKGTLYTEEKELEKGWSIYEKVTWK